MQWKEADIQQTLDKINKSLLERLEEQLSFVEALHDFVPAFGGTLHTLYTAHEVGRTVLNFCSYLSKQGKEFVERQKGSSTMIDKLARKILHSVVAQCSVVKKGLDEGSWIDKVLNCTLPDASETSNGVSAHLAAGFRELLDENFVEDWAGHVVESWRDSVTGFSYLKDFPAKE